MPRYDFKKPMSFETSLEQFSLALHSVMIALRNEVYHGDMGDQAPLHAANLLCSILEDAHKEATDLTDQIEHRVTGMKAM